VAVWVWLKIEMPGHDESYLMLGKPSIYRFVPRCWIEQFISKKEPEFGEEKSPEQRHCG
jgi:hypothetical protein